MLMIDMPVDMGKAAPLDKMSSSDDLYLPDTFRPRQEDVICSKGSISYHHAGNMLLREKIEESLDQYESVNNKLERSTIVSSIISSVKGSQGMFVRYDTKSKRWFQVNARTTREKVGQAIRAALKKRVEYQKQVEGDAGDQPLTIPSQASKSGKACALPDKNQESKRFSKETSSKKNAAAGNWTQSGFGSTRRDDAGSVASAAQSAGSEDKNSVYLPVPVNSYEDNRRMILPHGWQSSLGASARNNFNLEAIHGGMTPLERLALHGLHQDARIGPTSGRRGVHSPVLRFDESPVLTASSFQANGTAALSDFSSGRACTGESPIQSLRQLPLPRPIQFPPFEGSLNFPASYSTGNPTWLDLQQYNRTGTAPAAAAQNSLLQFRQQSSDEGASATRRSLSLASAETLFRFNSDSVEDAKSFQPRGSFP